MTVEELILELQKQDPDADVLVLSGYDSDVPLYAEPDMEAYPGVFLLEGNAEKGHVRNARQFHHFRQHLKRVSEQVGTWPAWKRNLL
jgi:hypothetical protein